MPCPGCLAVLTLHPCLQSPPLLGGLEIRNPLHLLGQRHRHEARELQQQIPATPAGGEVLLNLQLLLGGKLPLGIGGESPVARVLGRVRRRVRAGERCEEPVQRIAIVGHVGPRSVPSPSVAVSRLRAWCRCALTVSIEMFITVAISWYLRSLS